MEIIITLITSVFFLIPMALIVSQQQQVLHEALKHKIHIVGGKSKA